ncbi:class I SAM-dependent methyltransferase [Gandjariella thermophila]|uniref:50S ribosomal protein L11 methyltransferase n=1 Tax=Gandjariella thermophila TaxID=1931992 RepID=A0A4D4J8U6_9PSEU|nr:50S ribosomal protein L11 methyltransferase [Gandjariella thermophila]GDY31954.1 50S ribosomal protein L11 methyltransferase [Gandjariella thermophila]
MTAPAPDAFVRATTRLDAPPFVPEIRLRLAEDIVALWEKLEADLGVSGLAPPFWAFAWAGGQALARYLLDHPDLVAGRSVFDFASGSGLVAVAAMRAGAASAVANEIDRFAGAAIALNAEANGVHLTASLDDVLADAGATVDADLVLAGDVFYDRDMAERVRPFLNRAHTRGATVLVGDPGRHYLPRAGLERLADYEVPVPVDLEGMRTRATTVWRVTGDLR